MNTCMFKIDAALDPLMKPLGNHLSDVFIKNLSDMAGTGTED